MDNVDEPKKDFYYASGWFSEEQEENYNKITKALIAAGKTLFEPRFEAGNLNDEMEKIKNDNTLSGEEKSDAMLLCVHDIFMGDLKGIETCKAVFADISFRDTGVLVEIGYAIGKGIPVVLFDNSDRPKMNIMLAGAAQDCIRNEIELADFLSGEKVYNIGKDFE